jgi:hypothetical protein
MNRVSFDQLVRGVQPSSSELAFGGSAKKLERIVKLEKDMAVMAAELSMCKAQVQEMGRHAGNDRLTMQSKASLSDVHTLKLELTAYMDEFKQPIDELMHEVRVLKERQDLPEKKLPIRWPTRN